MRKRPKDADFVRSQRILHILHPMTVFEIRDVRNFSDAGPHANLVDRYGAALMPPIRRLVIFGSRTINNQAEDTGSIRISPTASLSICERQ